MIMKRLIPGLLTLLLCVSPAAANGELTWQKWSDQSFAEAKAKKRMVLLDLEAVWCHWCHVMEETTYRDAEVVKLLSEHFIVLKADQDANPDLSTRYGDWGWPATILFAPDGSEIAKIRGYRDPEQMAAILAAFIKDPTPGPSVEETAKVVPSQSKFLSAPVREKLIGNYMEVYDDANAGWGEVQKFIHTDSMDYALARAADGDAESERMAKATLDAAKALIDPEWGGIYQYSDKADWSSPHYEKIMWYQAQGLRQYSLAYGVFGEETYRKAASDIARYLTGPLQAKGGGFYTSQDADLNAGMHGDVYYALSSEARLKAGIPRIDTNIYARENGWAITALATYSDRTGDAAALDAARIAAEVIINSRALAGGGFSHGGSDRSGPYLGDTLAMGQAFVALYASTGERKWLLAAASAGDFIAANFRDEAGFHHGQVGRARFRKPVEAGGFRRGEHPGRSIFQYAASLPRWRKVWRACRTRHAVCRFGTGHGIAPVPGGSYQYRRPVGDRTGPCDGDRQQGR